MNPIEILITLGAYKTKILRKSIIFQSSIATTFRASVMEYQSREK
jgi:hypothetical protein